MSKRPDCCKDCIHSFTGHCYGCGAYDPTDEDWVAENEEKSDWLWQKQAKEYAERMKFIEEQQKKEKQVKNED